MDPETARILAEQCGMPIHEILHGEMPKVEVAPKFVHGEPLFSSERLWDMPTQMRRFHEWYMKASKEHRNWLILKVRKSHYFIEDEVPIEFTEFFQLFNLKELDKSILSCYCL